jgi:parvulin-like peptidyl-prolyl isomerase
MNIRNFCLATLLLAGSPLMAQAYGPAVTINDVEISRAKVSAQVDHMINQRGLNSGGITQPAVYEQLQQDVVERLITQELLWQEAQRRDVIASDADVDEQLEKMKSGFDTERAFLFQIEAGGFTEKAYREDIRQQRSVQQMIAGDLAQAVSVSDEEVQEFYDENIEQMTAPEAVRARHILVKLAADDEAAREAAQDRIAAIQKELQDGADFVTLATERSDAPSAPKGGDLGYFGRGQMVPPFEDAAFALQPGEISAVVETQFGFHIIRLEERREAEAVPVAEAAERITAYLSQGKLQSAVEDLVDELHASAEIENALAR